MKIDNTMPVANLRPGNILRLPEGGWITVDRTDVLGSGAEFRVVAEDGQSYIFPRDARVVAA